VPQAAGAIGRAITLVAGVHLRQARTVFFGSAMYLALVLLLIEWTMWLGTVSPWLVPPLFVIVV